MSFDYCDISRTQIIVDEILSSFSFFMPQGDEEAVEIVAVRQEGKG